MSYALQAHVEKFLQIDVTAEPEPAVTMLLENATGLISSWIGRRLELASYTETVDGPQGPVLFTDQWPLATSPAPTVTENGVLLTVDTDYKIEYATGRITRVTSGGYAKPWRIKPYGVVLTYDAGYDFTTDPLVEPEAVVARDVCTRIAARVFQASAAYANAPAGAAGIKTLSLVGSDSVTYSDSVSGVGGVTLAAVQLTGSDIEALRPLRRLDVAYG